MGMLTHRRIYFVILTLVSVMGFWGGEVRGQVSMVTTGSYSQNFNYPTLSKTAQITWADNSTIPNWYNSLGGNIALNTGTTSTPAVYNYGSTSADDRALGSVNSNTIGLIATGVQLKNNSGDVISTMTVGYNGEQWRKENNANQDQILFYFKVYASAITSLDISITGWTAVTALTFNAPIFGATTPTSLDGNASLNRIAIAAVTIPALSIPNGSYIVFKWIDQNIAGTDHGVAIDDVSIAWTVGASTNNVKVLGSPDVLYPDLKSAFDAINAGTHTGAVNIRVIGNTTETATAALNASGTGSASYTSINIQPEGASRIISGNLSAPIISLNGADNVTIDGRIGGTGSTKSLTITNTSSTITASTIQFINDASNNNVRYCFILGSNISTSTPYGTINIYSGNTTGNDNNTISYNDIGEASSFLPSFAIYSYSNSVAYSNDNNIVDNNNIFNYYSPGYNSSGIYLKSGSGITSNSGWTISNNRFYQTTARTNATSGNIYNAIRIGTSPDAAGGGYTITGNIIGYGASDRTGITQYGPTSPTFAYKFYAIQICQNSTTSEIQGNEIGGITLHTYSSATTPPGIFSGIYVEQGKVNIGTSSANIIGATSGTSSIIITTAFANSTPAIVPIFVSSSSDCQIQNNKIGAISTGGSANKGYSFYGIYISGSGSHTVNSNTIGNSTVNNIAIGISGTTTAETDVYGIYSDVAGASTTITIGNTSGSGNTIQNMSSYGKSIYSLFSGIENIGNVGNFNANYNTFASNLLAGEENDVSYIKYSALKNSGKVNGTINMNNNKVSSAIITSSTFGGSAGFIFNLLASSKSSTVLNINNNTFTGFSYTGSSFSGEFDAIYNEADLGTVNITDNIFDNLIINNSGDLYLCFNSNKTANTNFINNVVTTAFSKPAAGGNLYLYFNKGAPTLAGTATINANNFSNITLSGSTTFHGLLHYSSTNQKVIITNNIISNVTGGSGELDGIEVDNAASGSLVSGNMITNFNSASNIYGITIGYWTASLAVNVFNNTVNTFKSTGPAFVFGIYTIYGNAINVYKNKIFNLEANNLSSYVIGIYIDGGTIGSVNNFYNNLIGDLRTPITSDVDAVDGIYIGSSTTSTINVYFNTIFLNATSSGINFGTTGIYHTTNASANTATLDLRNNIIVNTSTPNGTGRTVAYRRSDATLTNYASTSNNNLFYTGATPALGSNPIFSDGTANDYSTLALYKALVSTREINSITEIPQFKSTTGSDPFFLHIKDDCTLTATGIESGGTTIGSPFDTDYDAEYRFGNALYAGGGTAPDIGADEFDKKSLEVTATAGTVGPTNYSTLKAAFTAINKGTHKDAITIKVLCSTAETATAALNASGTGSPLSSYSSVNMYPTVTGKSISGNIDGAPLVDLNGADNVIINGSLNGTGTSSDLTISNINTSANTGTSTIRLQADATNNTITYCNVLGSSTTPTLGTNGGNIWVGTASSGSGNDNNTISNCLIGPAGTNLPSKCIYMNGSTAGKENSDVVITGNSIYDYFSASSPSAGIYCETGNTLCRFTNNQLYQTSVRSQTSGLHQNHYGIGIANITGSGFDISGNTFGYATASGTGKYTFSGCSGKLFAPIYLNVGNLIPTSVQGNTITAISFSNSDATEAAFSGIQVEAGSVNIGTISANTIGANSGTDVITVANNSTVSSNVTGINYESPDNGTISNNAIGSITTTSSSGYPCNIYGISKSAVAGTLTIANNTIGSTATANSISAASTATAIQYVYGISNSGTGAITVSGNTIANMSNAYAGSGAGAVAGISCAGTGTYTVSKNFIYNLLATSSSPDIYGIKVTNGNSTYSNNIISLGPSEGCSLFGIDDAGITGSNFIYFNTVYIGGTASGTKQTFAMRSAASTNTKDIRNNIFYNARISSGSHYAISLTGKIGLIIDYNDYFVTGTKLGKYNTVDKLLLSDWQASTTQDVNSVSNNPNFSSVGGALATDYKPVFPVNLHGVAISGITVDFGNGLRHVIPTLGAWELACQSHGEWSGTVSTNWNVSGNWCDNSVPGSGTDVIIQNVTNKPEITITTAECNNMIVNVNAALQINAGQALTVNGNVTNNGTFTINSDALANNGSLIVEGSGSGTGTYAYNRFLEANKFYILSSPLYNTGNQTSIDGNMVSDDGGSPVTYNVAPYNELNNNWDYQPSLPIPFEKGKGYAVKLKPGKTNVPFTGTLNSTMTDVAVQSTGTYLGWNSLGNPFTSALKITAGDNSGFIDVNLSKLEDNYGAVYLWSTNAGNYVTISKVGYTPKYGFTDLTGEIAVQAGQGFLINVKQYQGISDPDPLVGSTVSRTVTFKKGTSGMQVHSTATTLKKPEFSWPGITLLATNNGRTRSTIVAFNSNMSAGLDKTYDAGLLSASDFNLYTHLVAGDNETHFTIQCLPENIYDSLCVPIGIDLPAAGQLTIKACGVILPEGLYPVLEDRLLQQSTPLKTESDSLTVDMGEATYGIGRFYLHIGGISTVGNTKLPEIRKFTARFADQKITIFGTAEPESRAWLYDMSGRKLGGEYRLSSANQNEIPAKGLANGIYLLRIEGKTGRQTLKITVLNR